MVAKIAVVFWTFACLSVAGVVLECYPYTHLDPEKVLANTPYLAAGAVVYLLVSIMPVLFVRPRDDVVSFALAAAGGVVVGLIHHFSNPYGVIVGILMGLVTGIYWVITCSIFRTFE